MEIQLNIFICVCLILYSSKYCIPYLKKGTNPHILNISPPLNMNAFWFKDHVGLCISYPINSLQSLPDTTSYFICTVTRLLPVFQFIVIVRQMNTTSLFPQHMLCFLISLGNESTYLLLSRLCGSIPNIQHLVYCVGEIVYSIFTSFDE